MTGRAPYALLWSRVEARWPHLYYAPGRWPTRDGYIPRALFYLLVLCERRLRLAGQLDTMWSVEHGYLSARLPKEKRGAFDGTMRRLEAYAGPLIEAPTAPAAPNDANPDADEAT